MRTMPENSPDYHHCRLFRPGMLVPPRTGQHTVLPVASTVWLEIGAGAGRHALMQARQNPQVHYIAIERTAEKFGRFARAAGNGPPGLLAVHADAIPWTVFHLQPAQLQKVFILYPNPEPHNPAQRWLNMPYFEFLLSRLAPLGEVILASNIPSYIEEAWQQAREVWRLPGSRHKVTGEGRTHFEIKYLQRGESCQELRLVRPADYHTRFDNWSASAQAGGSER